MCPYDSNGNASVTRNPAVTGQTVLAEQVNVPFADIQAMLGQVLLRSGVAPMTGALNSNNFKIVNVGDPTTDSDGANKNYVDDQITSAVSALNSNARKIETVNVNRLALLADKATSFRVTGARTITLTAAATLLANWWCEVWAVDSQVVIDPDAAETINGNATLVLSAGQKAIVFCTGATFFAFVTSDAQSGIQLQGYSFGLSLSNNGTDVANDVDILSGKAASDASPFNIMTLGVAITKRIDASWAVGSGNGGLDTGSVSVAGTYYVWIIQRSDTLVVDALFSLSATSPTMPANYDRKRLLGVTVRVGSENGPFLAPSNIGIGYDQTWQDVARVVNTSYRNMTNRPIEAFFFGNGGCLMQVSTDNSTWVTVNSSDFSSAVRIIPPGHYYRYFGGAITLVRELR